MSFCGGVGELWVGEMGMGMELLWAFWGGDCGGGGMGMGMRMRMRVVVHGSKVVREWYFRSQLLDFLGVSYGGFWK